MKSEEEVGGWLCCGQLPYFRRFVILYHSANVKGSKS